MSCIAWLTLLITLAVPARETQGTARPTAEEIFVRHARAVGGKDAYDRLTTRVSKGTITIRSAGTTFTGAYEEYAKAPNKRVRVTRFSLGDGATLDASNGFNGTLGWGSEISGSTVHVTRLRGPELALVMRNADLHSEIALQQQYADTRLTGSRTIGGRRLQVVEGVPTEGNPETLFFDARTGLLWRLDRQPINDFALQPVVKTYYEDYRRVDGILMPFVVRRVTNGEELIVRLTEVRHNVPLQEATFAAPAFAPAARPAGSVDDYIRAEMTKRRIPGLALVVVNDGQVVKMEGYGVATLEHNVPVTPDTVFELASVTKSFTAAAIMRLTEQGKVALDRRIATYLPGSPPAWKDITVRHLLTHTACLADIFHGFGSLGIQLDYATKDMFEAAAHDPMSCIPGTKYQYSDVGYFLLGMIVENASGQRYRDFLRDQFFGPLGMTATSVLDQWAVVKNRASGYTIHDGTTVNIRRVQQVELPSHFGIFSTVRDLAKWDQALTAGRALEASSLAAMWIPATLAHGGRWPYGFGWKLGEWEGHRTISHGGYTGTEYTRFPDEKLTVIVLTNLGLDRGDEAVDSWGLTYEVARFYLSSTP